MRNKNLVMPLKYYVAQVHEGSVHEASVALGITRATVYTNLKTTAFVFNNELYRKTRNKASLNYRVIINNASSCGTVDMFGGGVDN